MHNLGHLPSEIISLILAHFSDRHDLYTCTLINKHIYTTAHPLLWQTVKKYDNDAAQKLITYVLEARSGVGQYIRHLNLGNYAWTDTMVLRVMVHVPSLTSLDLANGSGITGFGFQHLARHGRTIKSLCLGSCQHTTSTLIQALAQHAHPIEQLTISNGCQGLTTDTFAILCGCPQLKRLSIGMSCFRHPWSDHTVLDLTRLERLTHLAISSGLKQQQQQQRRFWSIIISNNNIDNQCWSYLTHLSINGFSDRTDHGDHLGRFLEMHPTIKSLSLSSGDDGDDGIDDRFLESLPSYLPHLEHLGMDWNTHDMTFGGVSRLVRTCPGLTSLTLFCKGRYLTDDEFPHINDRQRHRDIMREYLGYPDFIHRFDQEAIDKMRGL